MSRRIQSGRAREKVKVPHLFPIKKILVPVDGSENAIRASKVAIVLAKEHHSQLIVMHVIPMPSFLLSSPTGLGPSALSLEEYNRLAEKETRRWVEDAVSLARKHEVPVRGEISHATTSIVQTITDFAKAESIDLIVIGTRGLGGFKKMVLGSVSSGVVTHAHCSVLVVR